MTTISNECFQFRKLSVYFQHFQVFIFCHRTLFENTESTENFSLAGDFLFRKLFVDFQHFRVFLFYYRTYVRKPGIYGKFHSYCFLKWDFSLLVWLSALLWNFLLFPWFLAFSAILGNGPGPLEGNISIIEIISHANFG